MAKAFALNNGLTVVLEEQHTAKVAALQIWVNVGSADERPDQAGLAHLHEHMLFKGTERRGTGQIAHEVEAHGGEINAWTSFDQTVYHLVIASPFARQGLDILADAVRHSAFDADELTREIEVVCEEIKRSEDTPARRASRDLFSTAFTVHPYKRPVIGWEETVRSFTREKVLAFYQQHYTPENMVLAVAGDVDEGALRDWAETLLGGSWNRPSQAKVARPSEPLPSARRFALREDPAKEAYINLAFSGPSVRNEDATALDLLALVAGQSQSSRLNLEVKRKRALVNEIHAFAYTPKDPGLFAASFTAPASQVPAALEETVRVLKQLVNEPVSLEELRTMKSLVEAEAVYQRETVQGLARKLGFYQCELGDLNEEARYYERIARLTPENLLETAQKYFRFDQAFLTGLLPSGAPLTDEQAGTILDRGLSEVPKVSPRQKRPLTEAPLQVLPRASQPRRPSEIVIERLPSGARIVIREEAAVPLVAIRAAFLGGTRFETKGNSGLTTLLSRMLNRGTPSHDAEEISHLLDGLNGALAGAGGRNSIGLRGEFLSKHFERGFALFIDCLLNPTFPASELDRERKLLMQDILTREDKPSALAFELFAKTLYQSHPYRLSTLGEPESVERLSRDDLSQYHREHMDPSQLVLCVVGDVRVDEVLRQAEAAFGKSTPSSARPPPTLRPEPKPTQPRSARRELTFAQSHLLTGFLGVGVGDPERHALDVLSTVLSGQGGRLFRELRDKRSLAYSVSSFQLAGVDPGYFAVYIGTSPEKVAQAREGIREELTRIRDERIAADELARAQRHLVGSHEIGLQRNSARAAVLALDECYGLGTENFLHYAERIGQVTSEDVRRCAEKVIDFSAQIEVVVGPATA